MTKLLSRVQQVIWQYERIHFCRLTDKEYATESQARTASMSLLLSINSAKPTGVPVCFGAVIGRVLPAY